MWRKGESSKFQVPSSREIPSAKQRLWSFSRFKLARGPSFWETVFMAVKSKRPARKRFKSHFRIYWGDEIALGPGKVELLQHISETGSISEAARHMDMSYNRAWLLVRTMNRCFKEPLVLASRGGDSYGGAELTKTGRQVLGLYQQLDARVKSATRQPLARLFSQLRD
jgi:molybdate transport system regulatory protein